MKSNMIKNEAIDKIKKEIAKLEEQKNLINSFADNEVVTEERWHQLCETPLRGTDLMLIMAKNIFPNGNNFKQYANGVYFDLYGFTIDIPTSRGYCVKVDSNKAASSIVLDEYKKHFDGPIDYIKEKNIAMYKKYKCISDKNELKEYIKNMICNKNPFIFAELLYSIYLLLNIKKRREKADRIYNKAESYYNEYLKSKQCYLKTIKERQERNKILSEQVIPELKKFTNKIVIGDRAKEVNEYLEQCKINEDGI